ncbi:hybrid sensor histidine kinase/response regulator [Noviherbaspirillum pedocola]|uniref:histidine kinase n=1 Tax=Noviherbaspirillum pedocola TaxID=2801341 RepID=A0A934SRS1_9BURK|nr:PAS domain S-box protein [Noviherbaspirillum pedocola]MBK4735556.1 PAS domain S-box protein [Noviherbaspirillum pedocola]
MTSDHAPRAAQAPLPDRQGNHPPSSSDHACTGASAAQRDLRPVLDSIVGFAVIVTDATGTVTAWNRGAELAFGWSEEEMRGRAPHAIHTPEDLAAGRLEADAALAGRDGRAIADGWYVRKNGERFWMSGDVTPLSDACGRAAGHVRALRDRTVQKQSELQLRRHNRTLEEEVAQRTRERDRIWRHSPDPLAVMRTDGLLLAVNPAWNSLLGYRSAELIGTLFFERVHPEDVACARAALARSARMPAQRFEIRCRSAAGAWRHFAWNITVEDGLVYASGRDVTAERKLAEQEMQANEMRLRLALDAGAMAAWHWDIRAAQADWIYGMDALHGLTPEQAQRSRTLRGYLALVHPEDRDALRCAMRDALHSVSDFQAEYRIVRADGQIRWVEARARILFDDTGEPIQYSGLCTDISERKRTERDLRFLARASAEIASVEGDQHMLQRVAQLAVPDFADWCCVDLLHKDSALERIAIAHADPDKVHAAWELHRRYPPDPQMPRGVWNVARSGKPEIITNMSDNLLENAISDPERLAMLRRLGFRSYIGVPIASQSGVLGVLSFISAESGRVYSEADLELAQDLARRAATAMENARLYRELQHSDRAKDVFLATLAHELRNPLAPIANSLALMQLRPEDAAVAAHARQVIGRQVGQFTRLVDDLLDMSRINTGKIEIKTEDTDLIRILEAALETSRPHIEAAGHALTIDFGAAPAPLCADPVRLAQVFSNLLNNAAKYTNPGGRIALLLEHADGEYRVRVRDNGVGISPRMLQNVFTIFTQVTHPVERSQGGLGIGLALVDGLVKMHGGRVEAFSEGVGRGSEFIVHLPCAGVAIPPAPLAAPAPGNALSDTTPMRLLVVDDNTDAADTIAELLRLLGNEVRVAHDGNDALALLQEFTPDAALLDIGLPDMDGYTLARCVREREDGRDMRLIALTGWGQLDDRERAAAAGFDDHWVKPVDLERLRGLCSADRGGLGADGKNRLAP